IAQVPAIGIKRVLLRSTDVFRDGVRWALQSDDRRRLALLWQILSGTGFPNQFFCDSWVVGFWRGRPWLAGRRIGKKSLDAFLSRFWIGWVTRRGDKCVRSTCRG